MQRIFGAKKPNTPQPTIGDAIKSTDERMQAVAVKINALDVDLAKLKEQLKKTPNNNAVKQRAIRLLKQRKLYEGQQDQLFQQSFNMEQANMTVDNLKNTIITVNAMKVNNETLKKQYKNINIDKIEQLKDDMQDQMEMANDLQDIIGRSYDTREIDDDELEAELDLLGDDLLVESESSYLDVPSVPISVPTENTDSVVQGEKPVGA